MTDFDNICGATEPGVQCSNKIDTAMKYFLCPQESIKCGGETIVIVPSLLARETTKFFGKDDVCRYKLIPIGNEPNMRLEIKFENLIFSEAYIMYKEVEQDQYTIIEVRQAGKRYEIFR